GSNPGYHVKTLDHTDTAWHCTGSVPDLPPDSAVSVRAQWVEGDTREGYGILFRAQTDCDYRFVINQSGSWAFVEYYNKQFIPSTPTWSASSTISTGADNSNKLEVRMQGQEFDFYINDNHVGSARAQHSCTSGAVGLAAWSPLDVVFIDFAVAW